MPFKKITWYFTYYQKSKKEKKYPSLPILFLEKYFIQTCPYLLQT